MSKLKPAIICGGVLGVLMVITVLLRDVTSIGFLGCCNCLWPIGAGLLGTLMFIKGSPTPAKVSDGAVVGILAGLVGAVIHLVVVIPLQYFLFSTAFELQMAQVRHQFPTLQLPGILPLMIIGGIIWLFIGLVLSLIGGLIAVPIFEKRKDGMPPPPPQNFGGGQAA
jgi:hypothetical protein